MLNLIKVKFLGGKLESWGGGEKEASPPPPPPPPKLDETLLTDKNLAKTSVTLYNYRIKLDFEDTVLPLI